jgi:hypothetical protein
VSSPLASRPSAVRRRAETFLYDGYDVDEVAGTLRCRYRLDRQPFQEVVDVGPGRAWDAAAHEAARLVYLLAGVSYYKAGLPPVIDLAGTAIRPGEPAFLRQFYVEGLGELTYTNGVSIEDLRFTGGTSAPAPAPVHASMDRPLVPFGGGLDSIVTVELVRPRFREAALFVLSRSGDRFDAIERAAAATGLPLVRAERELDARILRPTAEDAALSFNGHVPVTGILSAIAVLTAAVHGRGAVVMSNESSASAGNVEVGGRWVNHQYSKSAAFETGFRAVLAHAMEPPIEYFSELRPFSELWIARRFAALSGYHEVFHSCNRAFHLDPGRRLARWCGTCDKCCFIDLILAPFLAPDALAGIFDGREPLQDASLAERFRALLGTSPARKPFECVGDVTECRAALLLAAERPDRAETPLLHALAAELGDDGRAALDAAPELFRPLGAHHIPDAFLPAAALD